MSEREALTRLYANHKNNTISPFLITTKIFPRNIIKKVSRSAPWQLGNKPTVIATDSGGERPQTLGITQGEAAQKWSNKGHQARLNYWPHYWVMWTRIVTANLWEGILWVDRVRLRPSRLRLFEWLLAKLWQIGNRFPIGKGRQGDDESRSKNPNKGRAAPSLTSLKASPERNQKSSRDGMSY